MSDIIDICRQNALHYSQQVIKPENGFSQYFDWSDHIAVEDTSEFPYHLNKTAQYVEKLSQLFETTLIPAQFQQCYDNWYQHTVAAAWMHDIGMLDAREKHNIISAQYLFHNKQGFDFTHLQKEDKVKIGLSR